MARLKLGIDARNLTRAGAGISRYLLMLLAAFHDEDVDLRLYLPSPPAEGIDLTGTNLRIGSARGALARTVWGQVVLPRWAAEDRVDALWGPAHRLPLRLDSSIARAVTIHDLVWLRMPETMQPGRLVGERILMGQAIAGADAVIAVSEFTAGEVRAHYGAAARCVTAFPVGAPTLPRSDVHVVQRFGLAGPFILFVGTLEPRKNLSRLLAAYASLGPAVRTRASLVIAGGQGWKTRDLDAEIARLDIRDRVRLLGHVDDAELAALYAAATFLAFPSLYEGYGLPIVEANSAGTPVLTSNRAAMVEVGGDAAAYVDPQSVSSIADGMTRLLTEESYRTALAGRVRANADRYDTAATARAMLTLFTDLARGRHSR
ncbi:MAG: glycosyltransferase family 1 protein [Devosia sp.]